MTFSLPAYSRAISSTTGAMARQGAHHGAQKSISTGVGLAAELHEAVARALGLLARRRLTLRARLASRLGRRLAPALVVRQVRLDRIGRVVRIVVGEEERVEEEAPVDEEARAGMRMEERAVPAEAVPHGAMMGETPSPLRVGRGGGAERQGKGEGGEEELHRGSSPPRDGGGGGASTPPFAP